MSSAAHCWCIAPEPLTLAVDEVHVWRSVLDRAAGYVQDMFGTLAPDERARAERFHFERDQKHFIVARGSLRVILGRYLGRAPNEFSFHYTQYGRPVIAEKLAGDDLAFSVSHSQGLALFAVTRRRQLGVDLEWIRPGLAADRIAERFFSAQEVRVLRSLAKDRQDEAFFNCWTRKEAYIKAKGEGLSMPLDRFDVSLVPGEPATLLSTRGDPDEATRWSLRELFPGEGFAAALAVQGSDWQMRLFDF